MACGAFDADGGYVASLTSFVDCRVEQLAQGGYLALAADDSPVQLALAGLITILVALFGYRLLLGDRVEIRDGVLTAVRLGIVLSLATQWPAYQALVYNLVVKGPAELTVAISDSVEGRPEALPARIEFSYRALEALAHQRRVALTFAPPQPGASAPSSQAAVPLLGSLTIEEQKRLSTGSVVLLVSSLGALLSVRVAAGLLLALGPLFAICLLFDGLRGWFEGWVRGLAAAALGSVAASAVLALELAVIEPQLAELFASVQSGLVRPGSTTEIFATSLLFAIVLAATMLLIARSAAGFRLPAWNARVRSRAEKTVHRPTPTGLMDHGAQNRPDTTHEGRAQQIAEAVRMLDHRSADQHNASTSNIVRLAVAGGREELTSGPNVPLGRTYRRSQALVRSATAERRDQRS